MIVPFVAAVSVALAQPAGSEQQTVERIRSALLRLPYYGVYDFLAFRYDMIGFPGMHPSGCIPFTLSSIVDAYCSSARSIRRRTKPGLTSGPRHSAGVRVENALEVVR